MQECFESVPSAGAADDESWSAIAIESALCAWQESAVRLLSLVPQIIPSTAVGTYQV